MTMQKILSIFQNRWTLIAAMCLGAVPVYALNPTETTLALTAPGSAPTSITAGTVITLTASVTSGSSPVTQGQVLFCNALAPYCKRINALETAQLTPAGTAEIKLRPGVGPASYKAVFVPTTSFASSSSQTTSVAVVGQTSMSLAASGSTLTASVTGTGTVVPPTGTVSFLGSFGAQSEASLGAGTVTQSFANPVINQAFVSSVAVGDFNGDGIPDLVVVPGYSTQDVPETVADGAAFYYILLGNGDGTFSEPVPIVFYPLNATSVVVGDFNGDGISDLAFADRQNGVICFLLGNGDGTFNESARYSTNNSYGSSAPWSMAVADFNGDGIADLAYADNQNNVVGLYLGAGNGTFTSAGTVAAGSGPASIAVADFNGDGIPDLAFSENGDANVSVGLLLGNRGSNGTFTFVAGAEYSMGELADPGSIAVGDFNGDGIPDVAVANVTQNTVSVLLGKGKGVLGSPTAYATDYEPQQVVVGDFNGDGIPDLALSNADGHVCVLHGKGDGTFNSLKPYSGGAVLTALAVADFNGDGATDIAVGDVQNNNVNVLLNKVTVTSTASVSAQVPSLPVFLNVVYNSEYFGDDYHMENIAGPVVIER
jgi:hypothetical protein